MPVKILRTELVRLDEPGIQTHPKNPNEGDVGAISESLRLNGQWRPIVISETTGNICAGNHTWLAADALGWEDVLATFVEATPEEEIRILLGDNRIAELKTYDEYALVDNLTFLYSTPMGLDGTGYDADDLNFRLEELDTSGFLPTDDDQPRLDQRNLVRCPSCGEEFASATHQVK